MLLVDDAHSVARHAQDALHHLSEIARGAMKGAEERHGHERSTGQLARCDAPAGPPPLATTSPLHPPPLGAAAKAKRETGGTRPRTSKRTELRGSLGEVATTTSPAFTPVQLVDVTRTTSPVVLNVGSMLWPWH